MIISRRQTSISTFTSAPIKCLITKLETLCAVAIGCREERT